MQSAQVGLALRDLVPPLSPDDFLERHLLAGRHFLSSPNQLIVDRLQAVEAFRDVATLVRRLDQVNLFGPNGFRSTVPGRVAMDFYHRGDSLYLTDVQRTASGAAEIFGPVLADLGVHPQQFSIEVFAGRRGALSTLHYDHDINFHILVSGIKRWRMEQNQHIVNPLFPNHKLGSPREEARAARLPFPASVADLDSPVDLIASPGTCLFFPIGYWHEVEVSEDALSVNLAVKPLRWLDAIGSAARRALVSNPELRAPVLGALRDDDSPLKGHARASLAAALRAYADALTDIELDDVGLAADATSMRWSDRCATRRLQEAEGGAMLVCPALSDQPLEIEPELVPLMRRLVTLRGSFGLDDLKALAPTFAVSTLLQLMMDLKDMSYWEQL